MKVRVLGCSGAIAKDCRTTSFLIDSDILIDAGTGVGDLTLDEMCAVNHVFLTHSHLDHVAALPLMVDAVASQRTEALKIYALAGTIAALKAHIFNNVIWPDFSVIPSTAAPFISFHEIAMGQTICVVGKNIEALPAVHTVPAVGYSVSAGGPCWVFTGDTERNPAFWRRLEQLDVAMLVIETAFSNREKELARRSLHLSPATLASELDLIDEQHKFPIFITHTKPFETELIMGEIAQFDEVLPGGSFPHDIRWLNAGQLFEV
ncbi:Ribonuclease BN, tRNA processing enzyme [Rhodoferax sp. OV413]|uniref:3',5'-cyclic-nucleotide phosphodiesterase n=1 Tax=Rhodoferax sp. OV413 TaxID=1855285 RepID=UPI00089110A4|nr:3',5'-cyclic-nucleotide phosphodiesterase [Rhodoferax sp. OV413]SDO80647.1 Ribonuclease BN, tRNA processing enzyme [Rhodoferax sp. OV413]